MLIHQLDIKRRLATVGLMLACAAWIGFASPIVRAEEPSESQPSLLPKIVVTDETPVGTVIGSIRIAEDDSEGLITYQVGGGNEDHLIQVDPLSGDVILLRPLSSLPSTTPEKRNVMIHVTRRRMLPPKPLAKEFAEFALAQGASSKDLIRTESVPRETQLELRRRVPQFDLSEWIPAEPVRLQVPEAVTAGAVVGQLKLDTGDFTPELTYSLESQSMPEAFHVDDQGRVLVQNAAFLDFEAREIHDLSIRVSDRRSAESAELSMAVQVKILNSPEAPVLALELLSPDWSIQEDRPIARVQVTDADRDDEVTITLKTGLAGLTYDAQTQELKWSGSEEDFADAGASVLVEARDSTGLTATTSLWLLPPTRKVMALPSPPSEGQESESFPAVSETDISPPQGAEPDELITPDSGVIAPITPELAPEVIPQDVNSTTTNSQSPLLLPGRPAGSPLASAMTPTRLVLAMSLAGLCLALMRIRSLQQELQQEKKWAQKSLSDSAKFRLSTPASPMDSEMDAATIAKSEDNSGIEPVGVSSEKGEAVFESDEELRRQLADLFASSFQDDHPSLLATASGTESSEKTRDEKHSGQRPDREHPTPPPFSLEASWGEMLLPDLEYPTDQPSREPRKPRSAILDESQLTSLRTVANWSARNALRDHAKKRQRSARVAWSGLAMAFVLSIPLNGWMPSDPRLAAMVTMGIIGFVTWSLFILGGAVLESIRDRAERAG